MTEGGLAHPYMPNSAPGTRRAMLESVGAATADELFDAIPERLRVAGLLDLPAPVRSEQELRRRLGELLDRNASCAERLSFLGGGCWPHYVPAVCDEIVNRGEFLTAYYGDTYGDHGKRQALFEYASMLGELVECDAVSMPTYDWGAAAATSICMAARITGRRTALVPATLGPERRSQVEGYCRPWVDIVQIPFDRATGLMELDHVAHHLSAETACVYVEMPGFLGVVETQAAEIAALAHAAGALAVVGVDPISLGVLEAPPRYGADIVCGELQPLGVHMHYGGGLAGFIASSDEETFVSEYPTLLTGLVSTSVEGERAFGPVLRRRTAYVRRGGSTEYVGTTQNLWAIAAGVYLALLGPQGLAEVGRSIAARARYAARVLDQLPGVRAPALGGPFFKELVVDFNEARLSVVEINEAMRQRGIFGGLDLSGVHAELGQSALLCVTEVHAKADIDRLADELAAILR